MRIKPATAVLSFALAIGITGCINVNQAIEIESDGSGSFSMDLGVSESLMAMAEASGQATGEEPSFGMEKELVSDSPYVGEVHTKEYNEDGYKHYAVDADITDMKAFFSQMSDTNESGMSVSLVELDNGNLLFRQNIDVQQNGVSSDDSELDTIMSGMVANAFQGNYWTVTLKVPNLVDTNGKLDDETGVITWSIPMTELMNHKPRELTAEFRPTTLFQTILPYLAVLLAAGILIAAALLLIARRRRSQLVEQQYEAWPE